ncbi:hypothetical protein O7602_01045 [Micromonospora sp. WMMD1128]|uniref:hypothetical protein n=1 Tax=Micromonospora sp. WMMD1128 TaxID=3015150 RepID=UPI00248AEEA1|nr:hypothetical protein [Micromonospora sp. WMMD1128]WBB74181.1 hypothetical protein O7602_01045 [Micromonospora sp. WMMD1128]
MKSGARIALAVGFGYVLGRRRKLRTALTLAAAVAAGRASQNPAGLKQMATGLLGSNPQLSNLGKLGAPLVTAGRAAATAAAGSGIDAVSGRLRGGADALRRRSGGQSADGSLGPRSAPDEEPELDEQPDAGYDETNDQIDDEDRDEQPAPVRRWRGR